jgi:hypothetical protein
MARWTWPSDSGGWGSGWARSAGKPSRKPRCRRQASGRRRREPPAGFGCRPKTGTPVLKGKVGAELPAPLGAVDQLGDQLEQAGLGRLGGRRRGEAHAMASLRPRSAARSRQVSSEGIGEDVRPG